MANEDTHNSPKEHTDLQLPLIGHGTEQQEEIQCFCLMHLFVSSICVKAKRGGARQHEAQTKQAASYTRQKRNRSEKPLWALQSGLGGREDLSHMVTDSVLHIQCGPFPPPENQTVQEHTIYI